MFSDKDLKQIEAKGISIDKINQQISYFKKNDCFLDISKPATPAKGIKVLNDNEVQKYSHLANTLSSDQKIVKFVPASGAATRMFKSLFNTLNEGLLNTDTESFIKNIRGFAFHKELTEKLTEKGENLEQLIQSKNYKPVLQTLLYEMDYGSLPKGLLSFHKYDHSVRTSVEEHLSEGAMYAKNKDLSVYLHLTVSPEHAEHFSNKIEETKERYEKEFNVKYQYSWSIQKPSTDTLAVDIDNKPFRNEDGSLLFRPGGHGALIENLNEIWADVVFIKNIDNVVPDKLKELTVLYKKVIMGVLLETRNTIFDFLNKLESNPDNDLYTEIVEFYSQQLFIDIPEDKKADKDYLTSLLNRPIRVCGMVKNEGEPGGGPYFVKDKQGVESLQIVESSQINLKNPDKKKLVDNATHFNPVDLVCSVKDYKGIKFDLLSFVDPDTGFISEKSKDGKTLKAYELPGLWNGAMAHWNTIFVEVPIETFNPVKTVNDLLRETHQ